MDQSVNGATGDERTPLLAAGAYSATPVAPSGPNTSAQSLPPSAYVAGGTPVVHQHPHLHAEDARASAYYVYNGNTPIYLESSRQPVLFIGARLAIGFSQSFHRKTSAIIHRNIFDPNLIRYLDKKE
ncbi:hypothetical protein HDU96_008519 [Phlyctochytrium bullatum]|nr:hypothetical protein HDU96_008519 [Phlyctochytrium bullatum]